MNHETELMIGRVVSYTVMAILWVTGICLFSLPLVVLLIKTFSN